jgi:prephenate dehydrogenase
MKTTIGIIGFGRFGAFAARHLAKTYSVAVMDTRRAVLPGRGYSRMTLHDISQKKVIVLAVPINKLRATLKKISPFLAPGTVVCDVCSVKEQPIQWMKELLPHHVHILGLHPLFGPDSAASSLKDKVMVICPVRLSSQKLKNINAYFTRLGLRVVRTTPVLHDKTMASTLFLTQYVGRALKPFTAWKTNLTTNNFILLREIVAATGNDSDELFRDMYRYNRFAKNIPTLLAVYFRRTARRL